MRVSRSALASVVAAVLASVPVGVAVSAQDDEAAADIDPMAPASVSGVMTLVGPNQDHIETPGEPPVVGSTQNYGWTVSVETDDPRLNGTYETNMNEHVYASGEKAGPPAGT